MTLNEALNEITAKPRYYDGVMNQSNASKAVRDIRNGSAGTKKIANFLDKFGYKLEIRMEVRK